MIKVCHIITQLELGGAQQNTLYTVSHLDPQRFQPLLITSPDGLLVAEAERCRTVRKYYVPHLGRAIRPWRDLRALFAIWQILRQELRRDPAMPLIVHTHSSKAGILGRWAAKLAGVQCIIHSIHGFGFHPSQTWLKRQVFIGLERLTAPITTHFIAVSKANLHTGRDLKLFPETRVSLIRSGIEIARFQQYADRAAPEYQAQRTRFLRAAHIPQQKRLVGMIACFKPQKAPLDFIRAMQIVTMHYPDAHGILVGDGVLRPQLEALIAQSRLASSITLLGWRTDIPELIALFDVLALTSRWEGLPRVCPQAMAAGVPIVATNVDGTPEAVHDGVNGFVLPPGDINGIAEKIAYLLTHPEQAKQMGVEGQRRVQEFDIDRMVAQQAELYERLTNQPHATPLRAEFAS